MRNSDIICLYILDIAVYYTLIGVHTYILYDYYRRRKTVTVKSE